MAVLHMANDCYKLIIILNYCLLLNTCVKVRWGGVSTDPEAVGVQWLTPIGTRTKEDSKKTIRLGSTVPHGRNKTRVLNLGYGYRCVSGGGED
jgi:hypothetical protein